MATGSNGEGFSQQLESASAALREGSTDEAGVEQIIALSRRLLSAIERLEQLVEHVPAVLYIDKVGDPESNRFPTVYVGPQVEAVVGASVEDWIERDDLWRHLMHPDDWPSISAAYQDYLRTGGVLVQEYRIVRPDDGRTIWVRDDCAMSTDPVTGDQTVLGVMLDITEQKRLEEQLRAAEAKNRALVEQIPGIVWMHPLGENPEPPFVSASVCELFGIDRDEWLDGRWWLAHVHPDDRSRVVEARQSALASAGRSVTEYRVTTEDGRMIWIEEVARVVLHDGQPWIWQALLDDITIRKLAEQRLEFRAYHDPLTGLANRPLFDESLAQAIARAGRRACEVVVLFVDVDEFKRVNDLYGHDVGDHVLRVIAARLQQCARSSDLVARRGGDEYLMLMADIEAADATAGFKDAGNAVADIITERILDSMREPIVFDGGSVVMSLSIGRCVYPADAVTPAQMMAAADADMYRAKQALRTDD